VADAQVSAEYHDLDAARQFAQHVDLVTFEFENIPSQTLEAIAPLRPVFPAPHVLETCRHRVKEKTFLRDHGFPVANFRAVYSVAELQAATQELEFPCILKTADFGYDGKGQVRLERGTELSQAWLRMGRPVGVLEAFVPFSTEISVICARNPRGDFALFGPVENLHSRHILDVTTAPAGISPALARRARELGQAITQALDVVGLLTIEMFVVNDNVMVNELAPRPHNSGHYTLDACTTCQFEQQVRAVCNLPLGATDLHRPAAMANLLGDLWSPSEPDWSRVLALPDIKLHLYGKAEARPGRKMGHLTALADTPAHAREQVLAARARLLAPE
jgi:5-(carboxyamino)imidazole ribonucleotide synthase